jgi:hypothetical protein
MDHGIWLLSKYIMAYASYQSTLVSASLVLSDLRTTCMFVFTPGCPRLSANLHVLLTTKRAPSSLQVGLLSVPAAHHCLGVRPHPPGPVWRLPAHHCQRVRPHHGLRVRPHQTGPIRISPACESLYSSFHMSEGMP